MYLVAPEGCAENWPFLSEAIQRSFERALPPEALTNILQAILDSRLQVWALAQRSTEDRVSVKAVATTFIVVDSIMNERHMVVYSLTGVGPVATEAWMHMLAKVKEYAKEQGCQYIAASTTNKRVVELARRAGMRTEMTYVEMEV